MNLTLQQLAKQAKNRIKSGYYNREKRSNQNFSTNPRSAEMYEIVASIMDSEEVVINPLEKVMDKEYYNSLDDMARSRYILELSKQYIEMTNKYNNIKKSS